MAEMIADLIVILHLAFILFVVFGGLIALKWRAIVFVHIPCAIWGTLVELFGWVCPLTPLENRFREAAREDGPYSADFVDQYILPIIYPEGLTNQMQLVLAATVVLANLAIYGWVFRGWTKRSRPL